jgi:hypothetical protein
MQTAVIVFYFVLHRFLFFFVKTPWTGNDDDWEAAARVQNRLVEGACYLLGGGGWARWGH